MEIRLINDKIVWNNWLRDQDKRVPFTQSWEWGDILLAEGKKVERLAVCEGNEIVACAQVEFSSLPFGWRYAFCPRGPAMNQELRITNHGYELLADYLNKKNCIFFRVEPSSIIHDSRFMIQKTSDINPKATTILDLQKSEDELLAATHEKTRYNVRLAERKDLKIVRSKDFKILMDLMRTTGKRDGFRLHREEHYRAILDSDFSHQLSVELQTTNYKLHTPIATAVFVGFGDTFTYLYGASEYEHRNLMAPYLVQWEGIKLGKKMGYKYYDFFGIAPRCHSERGATATAGSRLMAVKESLALDKRDPSVVSLTQDDRHQYDPHHQYAGVTRFKLGFGGEVLESPGTFDLILSPVKYKVYQTLRKIRRLV